MTKGINSQDLSEANSQVIEISDIVYPERLSSILSIEISTKFCHLRLTNMLDEAIEAMQVIQ